MKRLLSILLVAVMALLLAACGEKTNSPGSSAPEGQDKQFTVAINNWGQANFFARVGKTSMEDELNKLGCKVVATVTDNTADRTDAIENMIQQGVDAIIIAEGDITECEAAILEAREAGIVIGSTDAGTADYVDIYVSSDNANLGQVTAEKMVEAIGGKGKIVEIITESGSMIRQRRDAMHDVIEGTEVEVAYSLNYNWPDYYADIKSKVEAVLQANPNPGDISAIFASFDGVGIAAYDAIKEAGLQDSIVIVGVDGDPDAYKLMQEEGSNYLCTVAQDPETIARTCCQKVVDLLNGKSLESNVIYIPGILVTRDNVDQYAE